MESLNPDQAADLRKVWDAVKMVWLDRNLNPVESPALGYTLSQYSDLQSSRSIRIPRISISASRSINGLSTSLHNFRCFSLECSIIVSYKSGRGWQSCSAYCSHVFDWRFFPTKLLKSRRFYFLLMLAQISSKDSI